MLECAHGSVVADGDNCQDGLIQLCGGMNSDRLAVDDPLDRKGSWTWWVEHWEGGWGRVKPPCQECIDDVREKEKDGREDLWERLPSIFDIVVPGWPGGSPRS